MKRRGVLQNSALALLGDLSLKTATFVVMAVAAHGLPTAQFALLAVALATATLLTSALDLGSQVLLTRDGVAGAETRGALLVALTRARAPLVGLCVAGAVAVGLAGGHLPEALAAAALALVGAAQLTLSGALRAAQDLRPEAVSKLAGGLCTVLAGGACVLLAPRASTVLLALTVAGIVTLAPMAVAGRAVIRRGPPVPGRRALRGAVPLGLMALATLAYYRSGTIVLSLVSGARQTAEFAAASTVGWGLLAVGNAVTTGLLPRIAESADDRDRALVTRRALGWMTATAAALGAAIALLARPLMVLAFGARYAGAATPLAILALASIPIGAGGVLGTALIAAGRIRPVANQVAASLIVNLLVLALLAPHLGAIGAALATLACEAVALLMLSRAAARELPGTIGRRSPAVRVVAPAARRAP